MDKTPQDNQSANLKWKQRLKKIGLAGFLFFLLKGIAWLFVFYFAGKGCF
jgi:hypothetical protein